MTLGGAEAGSPFITRKEVVLHEHHPQTSTWSGPLLFVVYTFWRAGSPKLLDSFALPR